MSHLTMSAAEYEAHQRKRGKLGSKNAQNAVACMDKTENKHSIKAGSKYKNEPTWIDGIRFDSKKEAKRYQDLLVLSAVKNVRNIELQPRYRLNVNDVHVCDYIGDFRYVLCGYGPDPDELIVEDCKGVRTAVYKLKKKLMKAIHGIEILET